jgi:DNA-binding MarR family transcriptional regulator
VTTGVRTNDPDTSYAAAAFIKDHVTHLQGLVMEFLNQRGEHGATTEEIARHYGIELGSITPRMAPLERMGVVRRTDLRRMAQGKKVGRIVWQSIKACPQ